MPTAEESWICVKCMTNQEKWQKQGAAAEKQNASPSTSSNQQLLHEMTNAITNAFQRIKVEPNDNANDWTVYLKRQALINLPKFDGSAKEWPKFEKVFNDTTLEGRFTAMENLNRLQQSLVGAAAKSVNQLMMDPGNVANIMARLKLNYGRPETIYNELVSELAKIRKETKTAVIEISEALDNLVSNLELINYQDYLRDPRLIDETVRKLPYSLQVKWTEERQVAGAVATLKDLNQFLEPHAKTMRMMQPSSIIQKDTKKGNINVHQQNNYRNNCANCSGNHRITDCQSFRDMNARERNEIVRTKKLCLGCLSPSHFYKTCKRAL
ncbi:hypothetical protein RP20_CCG007947 [Aedes albopictus]|nr:hypothetical protein RP20_CCG007947 [Aedes albopictus]